MSSFLKKFHDSQNKTEEQKFSEARIEFLLEQVAKLNNVLIIKNGEIAHLKKLLNDYKKPIK